jgi:hypothetical protein
MEINYFEEQKLKTPFFNIVLNVKSLNQKFGLIKEFESRYPKQPFNTNGELITFCSMSYPCEYFDTLVNDIFPAYNLIIDKDYVYVSEIMVFSNSESIGKPIVDIAQCPWLNSIVLIEGTWVWYKEPSETPNHELDYLNWDWDDNQNIVSIEKNDFRIYGLITIREKTYLEVDIIYPYKGWKNHQKLYGKEKQTVDHFKTEKGIEVAKKLLEQIYYKCDAIDRQIDQIADNYDKLKKEQILVATLEDGDVKNSIKNKLDNYFYINSLFNINMVNNDKEIIDTILENYLLDGTKIYF